MLGVGHEAQNLILEKIMLRNPKGKPGPNFQGYNVGRKRTQFLYSLDNILTFWRKNNLSINCSFQALPKILEFSGHICCSKSNLFNLKIVKLNKWSRPETNFVKKKNPHMDPVTQHPIKTERISTVGTWKYLCISLQELQYPYATRCQLLFVKSYVLFGQNNQCPQLLDETFPK
jgi:hypothetical protein